VPTTVVVVVAPVVVVVFVVVVTAARPDTCNKITNAHGNIAKCRHRL
jgi:hypothetical protein